MATVVVCGRSSLTVKLRRITGILGYSKFEGIVKTEPTRYHHVASDICRNYIRRIQHRKTFIACSRDNQRGILGFAIARSASTGIDSDNHGLNEASNVTRTTDSTLHSAGGPDVVTSLGPIPEPPPVPPAVEELIESLPLSGEATFASQGLGGWSPVGIVQNCMEYLHIGCDLPWWTSIMIGTLVVRILIFPLVILSQKNAAKMANNLPQLQVLQMKMSDARQTGNQLEAARYGQELAMFMKEKQLNPLKNIMVPLAQAPLFISFFMGLRQMANVPVDSMRSGGLFWFEDLTVPDPYYLLPVITSFTMWVTIEVGTDGTKLSAANLQTMKYVLRALPVVIFPFTLNFPGAILMYWVSTNFISLVQVGFLKIPRVREFFKIEKTVEHSPDSLPSKPKGFVKGLQDSWTNMKITKELDDRQRFDELQFQRAGRGPIQKTYKYDPTKPRPISESGNAIAAKKIER